MIPILIVLVCIGLIYKAIEITQIAYCSTADTKTRTSGIVLGVLLILGAVAVSFVAITMTAGAANSIGNIRP